MGTHPFSTPDGNKTYCKTCGYTREAGNHVISNTTLTVAYEQADGQVIRRGAYANTRGGREIAEMNARLYMQCRPGLTAEVEEVSAS